MQVWYEYNGDQAPFFALVYPEALDWLVDYDQTYATITLVLTTLLISTHPRYWPSFSSA
jgi:hypothetical protein